MISEDRKGSGYVRKFQKSKLFVGLKGGTNQVSFGVHCKSLFSGKGSVVKMQIQRKKKFVILWPFQRTLLHPAVLDSRIHSDLDICTLGSLHSSGDVVHMRDYFCVKLKGPREVFLICISRCVWSTE